MKRYTLQGLDCANCAAEIERSLNKSPAVRSAAVNFAAKTLSIDTDNLSEAERIIRTIEPIELIPYGQAETQKGFLFRRETIRTAASLVLFAAAVIFQDRLSAVHRFAPLALFLAAWLGAGWTVLFSAAKNIIHGRVFDENFLMTVSTIGAFSIGALSEAAAVMIFYRIGETFQDLSVERSRKSIKSLLTIRPDSASVLKGSELVSMKPEDVLPGMIIVVKPGEKIPLDGDITEGASSVDTSSLTGESLPRTVKRGDGVLSGTVNLHGTITVKVTKPFAESSVTKMLELVENASSKKASSEKFITSFARVYTPIVVIGAAAVAVIPPLFFGASFHDWLYKALVLLVISCPCALVVSIPLSYFGGIGGASRRGILVKGSTVFDSLVKMQTVVFDKTGTLTKGVFKVKEVVSENGFSRDEILRFAADAELHSNHPIAVSIRESFGREVDHSEIGDYTVIPGFGVQAVVQGRSVLVGNDRLLHEKGIDHRICCTEGTVVHVVVDNIHAGYIVIADELKDDAAAAIRSLKKRGIHTVMLTGDTPDAAATAAEELKIDEFKAGLLPEEKVAELEKIMAARHGTVAFVGDGVNDAPVIARADIGVAMGALGSDAAIETADLVIMSDAPSKICEAAERSAKVRRIVSQNIVFALGIKLIVAGMGIAGIATMWEAVFADMGVALLAIFNAMRALR